MSRLLAVMLCGVFAQSVIAFIALPNESKTTLILKCFGWRDKMPELVMSTEGPKLHGVHINQTELDSITHVHTDLVIADQKNLTSVGSLWNIKSVAGNIEIRYNPRMRDLSALNNVEWIGGDLNIHNNHGIVDLEWFGSLQVVGGSLTIISNEKVERISGFRNLQRIGGDMKIGINHQLREGPHMPSLQKVDGKVEVTFNNGLISTKGMFASLLEVGEVVLQNKHLEHLDGFPTLERVEGDIEIKHNTGLQTIEFQRLKRLAGNLSIHSNQKIQSVWLDSLQHIGGDLEVRNNKALVTLNLSSLQYIVGDLEVKRNKALVNLNLPSLFSAQHVNIHDDDSIMDLSSFGNLTDVSSLRIAYSSGLKSLALSQLVAVSERLSLEGNSNLASVELPRLQHVGAGGLEISLNAQLLNISSTVVSIAGDFDIKSNALLANLNLPGLLSVAGHFNISTNSRLRDFRGLAELTSVGDLSITSNAALAETFGFENLHTVGALTVTSNLALRDISGFRSLERIHTMTLASNLALQEVSGFGNLKLVGSHVRIEENPSLLNVAGFHRDLHVQGDVFISNNLKLERVSSAVDWTRQGGFVNIQLECPEGAVQPTLSHVECEVCLPWEEMSDHGRSCETKLLYLGLVASLTITVAAAGFLAMTTMKRVVLIDGVKAESFHQVTLTTLQPHDWHSVRDFPVLLRGTGCAVLDSPKAPIRARVIGDSSVELFLPQNSEETALSEASMHKSSFGHGLTQNFTFGERQKTMNKISTGATQTTCLGRSGTVRGGTIRPKSPWEFRVTGVYLSAASKLAIALCLVAALVLAGNAVGVGIVVWLASVSSGMALASALSICFMMRAALRRRRSLQAFRKQLRTQSLVQTLEAACWAGTGDFKLIQNQLQLEACWTELYFQKQLRDIRRKQSLEAGVSVAYLISSTFLQLAQNRSGNRNPNFYELKQAFFFPAPGTHTAIGSDITCPRDGRLGCALIDTLSSDFRKPATHFLSWTWGYTVSSLSDGLQNWMQQCQLDPVWICLYMCFFSNNQYRILVEMNGVGSKDLENVFEKNLQRIGKMVALLDQWDKPVYLSRIWTIFEQFTAIKFKIDVEIIMPSKPSKDLIDEIRKGEEGIMHLKRSFSTVDSERAQAWSPDDERKVKMLIEQATGFKFVDMKVREFMVHWVSTVIEDYLKQLLVGSHLEKTDSNSSEHLSHASSSSSSVVMGYLENMDSNAPEHLSPASSSSSSEVMGYLEKMDSNAPEHLSPASSSSSSEVMGYLEKMDSNAPERLSHASSSSSSEVMGYLEKMDSNAPEHLSPASSSSSSEAMGYLEKMDSNAPERLSHASSSSSSEVMGTVLTEATGTVYSI
eukprot:TRINITY_DN4728_c0_g2_i1.p1 TRINITY_DN4728_c0_g2~~TRINITY_DN4728_c0_g2_i1.p1  ORF type:complete len:1378 (+),score=201.84 TRINITY_DN4728_c0_g2_i1:86-4135(+)